MQGRSGRKEEEATFNGEKKRKGDCGGWICGSSRMEAKLEDIAWKNDHDKKGEMGDGKRKLSHHDASSVRV